MKIPLLGLVALTGLMLPTWADSTVSSPPMGGVTLVLQGRTDNLLSIPLLQEPVAIGRVLALTADTVTLDTQGLTENQFAPAANQSYYAEISTGNLKGLSYPVVNNGTATFTLDTGTDNLTQHPLGTLAVGTTVRIRPAWNVAGIFGASGAGLALTPFSVLPSAMLANSGDSLLFFEPGTVGIQKVPSTQLVFVQSDTWRSTADGSVDRSGEPLLPLEPVLARRHSSSAKEILVLGQAWQSPTLVTLAGGDGTKANDAFVALAKSEPVSLNDTGLVNADPALSAVKASPSGTHREDVLLAMEPTGKGFERSPEHTYYYLDGEGWREVGSTSTTVGTDVQLDPAYVYVLRKRADSATRYWLQNGVSP